MLVYDVEKYKLNTIYFDFLNYYGGTLEYYFDTGNALLLTPLFEL